MKKLCLLFVLVAAIFTLTACFEDDGGVLVAKKSLTVPAEIGNIPVGKTLAIDVEVRYVKSLLSAVDVPEDIDEPFNNDFEEATDDGLSFGNAATVAVIDKTPFLRGGVDTDFIKSVVEAEFAKLLASDEPVMFSPLIGGPKVAQKGLYSSAPADFDWDSYYTLNYYKPVFVEGGEPLVSPYVLVDDPADADYTLKVRYDINAEARQIVSFENTTFTGFWDADAERYHEPNDLYLYLDLQMYAALVDNATGATLVDSGTTQGDAHIKADTESWITYRELLTQTDDAAAFLNSYDFVDKAEDWAIESVEAVAPRYRVFWYCNFKEQTIVYPEAEAE